MNVQMVKIFFHVNAKSKDITTTQKCEDVTQISDLVKKAQKIAERKKFLSEGEFQKPKFYLTLPNDKVELDGDATVEDVLAERQPDKPDGKFHHFWARIREEKKVEPQPDQRSLDSGTQTNTTTISSPLEESVNPVNKSKEEEAEEIVPDIACKTITIPVEEMTKDDVENWFLSFNIPEMTFWATRFLSPGDSGQYLKKFDDDDFKEHDAVKPFKKNFMEDLRQLKLNGYKRPINSNAQ